MDPQTDLPDLVEDLEVNIDELLTTLTPLLPPSPLPKTAQSLPLLEKAKLYTLLAYAIESTLYSALTLSTSGVDPKAHPVFAELARLKGYFAKIKDAEEFFKKQEEKEARARLDVGAAQRFIKHGLAGNERYDALRKERVEGEKARALEKARRLTNKKFEEEEGSRKRAAEGEETPVKKARVEGSESEGEEEEEGVVHEEEDDEEAMDLDAPAPEKKKRGRPAKKGKAAAAAPAEATPQKDTPTRATRSSAPKTRSEAFQALASGSPAAAKGKGKGRGKGKGKGK